MEVEEFFASTSTGNEGIFWLENITKNKFKLSPYRLRLGNHNKGHSHLIKTPSKTLVHRSRAWAYLCAISDGSKTPARDGRWIIW
jgi:hypothetical protein